MEEEPRLVPQQTQNTTGKKEVRIFCNGCFDILHYGHTNLMREAKKLGDKLIVGIHTDEEIIKHKGPPVCTLKDRVAMMRGIKWVDEIVVGTPFITTLEMLDKYNCDFCVHGENITRTYDGVDANHLVKAAKRYIEIKRMPLLKINLICRILMMKRDSSKVHVYQKHSPPDMNLLKTEKIVPLCDEQESKPIGKVVYVSGAFDYLHVGHMEFLKKAKKLGDYLIVGVHSDLVVNSYKGGITPVMNLQERVLSLLSCKYVSQVLIAAPYSVTEYLLDHFNVDVVCHGLTPIALESGKYDPYWVAKERNIFVTLNSGNDLTTELLVERIVENLNVWEKKDNKIWKYVKEKFVLIKWIMLICLFAIYIYSV